MKVKSESEVAQSCLTLSNPMDCSLPGSSAHGISQARVLEWGAIAFLVRLFIWLFSCFLRYACITMNFLLRTAFTLSYRFWVVVLSFSFVSMQILISFFYFVCDLLVSQQRVVQPPDVGIFNSFSPVIEI